MYFSEMLISEGGVSLLSNTSRDGRSSMPRGLPDGSYVGLTEALTWLAFGDALTLDELRMQVMGVSQPSVAGGEYDVPGIGYFEHREDGLKKLRSSWTKVVHAVDENHLKIKGRYTSNYSHENIMRSRCTGISSEVFSAFWLFDVSTGGIRGLPPTSLSPEVMWQFAEFSFDRELECFVEEDAEARKSAAEGYLHVKVDREGLRALQDPEVKRQADEAYVIAWCIDWLESGGRKGMDPAWVKFHADPKHERMTRDDWFRPAWKKAKPLYQEKISRENRAKLTR